MTDGGGARPEGAVAGLAEALAALRQELSADVSRTRSEQPQFEVTDVEVEFSVETAMDARGGVKLWVVNAGGLGAADRPPSHRVRLRLTPSGEGLGEELPIARSWDEGDQPRG
jgi:Trypsin-co-occurring domain 2